MSRHLTAWQELQRLAQVERRIERKQAQKARDQERANARARKLTSWSPSR